jgi:hypothetical protein
MAMGVVIAAPPRLTTNSRRFTWISSPRTIIVDEIEPTTPRVRAPWSASANVDEAIVAELPGSHNPAVRLC